MAAPPTPLGRPRQPCPFDQRLWWLTLSSGATAVLVALVLLFTGDLSDKTRWTLALAITGPWLVGAFVVRERIVRSLQTVSNLLAALREGDFSIRARSANQDDALGQVHFEVNALGTILREQRLIAMEATTLLRSIMAEIDVAIFAFDEAGRLRLVNRSGQELLAQPAERVLGRTAEALGLADCLEGEATRILPITFPGGTGRWGVRRTRFRERGLPHELVVIADLSRPLREEELRAWQKLVRVLGHEMNNSLAPIKSLAGSLDTLLKRKPADWENDMAHGLEIIGARADGLARFMEAYARLARLPPPKTEPADLCNIIRRVTSLETRVPIALGDCPPLRLPLDAAQIEQLLINAVKNAADASLQTGGSVRIGWTSTAHLAEVSIEDDGPGIANPANLFVPFFTTKPGGSGIGLVLCRQIAENHRGTFTLANRPDQPGAIACLRLPLHPPVGG